MCDHHHEPDCPFPYWHREGETSCDITYAEYLGTSYLVYRIFFGVLATGMMLAVIWRNLRLWYYSRSRNEHRFKKGFLAILFLMSFFLFLQGIDPQAYNGIISSWAEALFTNLCTVLGLILVVTLVLGFGKSLKRFPDSWILQAFWIFCAALGLVLAVVFAEYQHRDRDLYRGIKLLIFAGLLTIVSLVLTWHLKGIIKMIDQTQITDPAIIEMKYRVKMYLYLYDLFALVLVMYQVAVGIASLTHDLDYESPVLNGDQIIFPLMQFVGILMGFMYTNDLAQQWNQSNPFLGTGSGRMSSSSKPDTDLSKKPHLPIPIRRVSTDPRGLRGIISSSPPTATVGSVGSVNSVTSLQAIAEGDESEEVLGV